MSDLIRITPGKWNSTTRDTGMYKYSPHVIIRAEKPDGTSKYIATVNLNCKYYGSTKEEIAETHWNAQLIENAPDLLRAMAVLLTTPHIREYLEKNDPRAYEQAKLAFIHTISPF